MDVIARVEKVVGKWRCPLTPHCLNLLCLNWRVNRENNASIRTGATA